MLRGGDGSSPRSWSKARQMRAPSRPSLQSAPNLLLRQPPNGSYLVIEIAQHGFIVVDRPRGNDATAQRDSWSNPSPPWAAFRLIRDYDTVLVYPGPYQEKPLEPFDIAVLPGGGAPLLAEKSKVRFRSRYRPSGHLVHRPRVRPHHRRLYPMCALKGCNSAGRGCCGPETLLLRTALVQRLQ